MNRISNRLSWIAALAIFATVASLRAATIKEDADVFSGRDKKIGRLMAGAEVAVIEESGEWVKVRFSTDVAEFEGHVRRDLVSNAESPRPRRTEDAPAEVATPPPAASVTNTAVTARPMSQRTGPEIALSAHWQIQDKSGSILAADLAVLLKDVAKPKVNLVASENYVLFRDLYFMMPLADALKQCGQGAMAGDLIKTPGFPADSFKTFSFDPRMENISRLTLVADAKNQLVAVQVTDSGIKDPWLYRRFSRHETTIPYTESLRLYDIVQGRTKGSANWRVGAIMEQKDGIVQIDTELVTGNPEVVETVKSKERIRLILPQPVADLIAQLLENRK